MTAGQRTTGMFAALGRPAVYDAAQHFLGATRLRRRMVRDFGLPSAAPGPRARTSPARILDVGCGTARILDHLGECDYLGIDRSERYLSAARARYGRRARFVRADIGDDPAFEGDAGFDVVLMFGLLHHLDDRAAAAVLAAVARRLAPGGRLLTLDGVRDPSASRVAHLLVSWDRGLHVRGAEEYRRLAEPTFSRVSLVVRRDLLHAPYTHAILECFA